MAWLGVVAALTLIVVMLVDAFEAMILPRRVRHSLRPARIFYVTTWHLWKWVALRIRARRWRYGFLSIFGPLSLFALMAFWAFGLICGFALLHWSLDTRVSIPSASTVDFITYLYFSGTTFFTLGYGDVVPMADFGRVLSVTEAGIGFGFLAVVISYLPVLYQAFSQREITISLLDARAGSPPSAGELLRRLAEARSMASVGSMLIEWERWASEVLESHLSYPILRFYRSQHDNQSWVGALTAMLDTTSFLIANLDATESYQAGLTFAMARHAAVDLTLVTKTPPLKIDTDRLPPADFALVRESLQKAGLTLRDEHAATKALCELRGLYEPFVNALAASLLLTLPPFVPANRPIDNWQTSPGMDRSPGLSDLQALGAREEHAD